MNLNETWERRILESGADFVRFIDVSALDTDITREYPRAVLFGKALSVDYVKAIRADKTPETKEIFNTERKLDALAVKAAGWLSDAGYKSVGHLKTGLFPHKTAALMAGLGFIGKNNLLVTRSYGCALMLGKVLTDAPFVTSNGSVPAPECGKCNVCADVCPTGALAGRTWDRGVKLADMLTRKDCVLCQKCMMMCPYTAAYAEGKTGK